MKQSVIILFVVLLMVCCKTSLKISEQISNEQFGSEQLVHSKKIFLNKTYERFQKDLIELSEMPYQNSAYKAYGSRLFNDASFLVKNGVKIEVEQIELINKILAESNQDSAQITKITNKALKIFTLRKSEDQKLADGNGVMRNVTNDSLFNSSDFRDIIDSLNVYFKGNFVNSHLIMTAGLLGDSNTVKILESCFDNPIFPAQEVGLALARNEIEPHYSNTLKNNEYKRVSSEENVSIKELRLKISNAFYQLLYIGTEESVKSALDFLTLRGFLKGRSHDDGYFEALAGEFADYLLSNYKSEFLEEDLKNRYKVWVLWPKDNYDEIDMIRQWYLDNIATITQS